MGVTGFPTTYIVDQSGRLLGTPVAARDISETIRHIVDDDSIPDPIGQYRLQSHENVRRVAPPFPIGRKAKFLKHSKSTEDVTLLLTWNDRQWESVHISHNRTDSGNTVKRLLASICPVAPQYIRGDEQLLKKNVTGDFVLRSGAATAAVVSELQKILSSALKTQVTLELKDAEEDVYVARGKYKLSDVAKERGLVIIEGTIQGGRDTTIEDVLKHRQGAMRPPFDHFVTTSIAGEIGFPVINEVENPPNERVFYSFLGMPTDDYKKLKAGPNGGMFMPAEPILKSVSEQTGLTFTKEKRKVTTLTLKNAE